MTSQAKTDRIVDMQRQISIFALLFSSISAIIGSGWLFAAYYTSMLAGPASLISWLIGGAMMVVIAFVFAELSSMLPITGSSTRIPHYTHGTLVSFFFSWMIWLSYASLPPTETQAVLQYLSYFFPSLLHQDGALASHGYALAFVIMLFASALNVFSLRWLMQANSVLTVFKIAIPIIIGVIILSEFFTWHRVIHAGGSTFMPMGWHGVIAAITTGGIVFAFNGFKQACELAGEAKRPHIALPVAVIGSILVSMLLYLMLQFSLLSSLNPHNLLHGWQQLSLKGANSPLASVVMNDHLTYLMPLLYAGAIIAPMASGLIYVSSASRSLFGMSKNQQLPKIFMSVTKDGSPMFAIGVNFVLGMLMFLPLPGWNSMVSFLASIMAVTYAVGPICLITLRAQAKELHRPFKLPLGNVWSSIAFYFCTLLIYWCGWAILFKLSIALVMGLVVLFVHRSMSNKTELTNLNLLESAWIWPYFSVLIVVSYFGDFGGGRNLISNGWAMSILAVNCLITIFLACRFRLHASETQAYIQELKQVPSAPLD